MAHSNEIEDGDRLFLRAGQRLPGYTDRLLSYVLHPGAPDLVGQLHHDPLVQQRRDWRHQASSAAPTASAGALAGV
jgi:hypothetical protein